jgi:hypothetical protein
VFGKDVRESSQHVFPSIRVSEGKKNGEGETREDLALCGLSES